MFTYEILGDGLVYYKNIIQDPYKIIDDIETLNERVVKDIDNNVPGSQNSAARPWHNWDHSQGDMHLHFCKQRWLPRSEDMQEDDVYYKEYSSISDRLFDALDTSFKHYSEVLYPYAARNLKGKEDNMSILKYEKAGYLPAHTDHGSSSRTLSVVLYLNDNYDGGEISFPYVGKNGVKIKPEAGSAIFFPSMFVYVHEISEVTNGIRYALPNWYHNMMNKIYTDGSE
jgi:Rps23 Pro-64 3,4-dihydroxylase Tpa1-like proline 4-hydroxylase